MWPFLLIIISLNIFNGYGSQDEEFNPEQFHGRYFPYGPGETDTNPGITENEFKRKNMIVDKKCDDGKTNISVDWDGSNWAHSCFIPKYMYRPNRETKAVEKCVHIPEKYEPQHICMNETINYDWSVPTFGSHRAVWAKYGEYEFLPKQRWLHNLEHGGVAVLYHPCAYNIEVERLKNIVKSCLWRYVITPNRDLSEERPLVLLTYGCSLEMSYVHEPTIRNFIKTHALKKAVNEARDGEYVFKLKYPAKIVSDQNDSILCPDQNTNSNNLM